MHIRLAVSITSSSATLPKTTAPLLSTRSCTNRGEISGPSFSLQYPCRCPSNSYCPEGSWAPTHCPSGTGHIRKGASSVGECVRCGAGVYCGSTGEQNPCDEGFVCYGAAVTARPMDSVTGDLCPKGHFCPEGTTNTRICPIGTFGPTKGLGAACDKCPSGRLCSNEGNHPVLRLHLLVGMPVPILPPLPSGVSTAIEKRGEFASTFPLTLPEPGFYVACRAHRPTHHFVY